LADHKVRPLSSVCAGPGDASVLWPNGLDDRADFSHTPTATVNHELGGCPNLFRGRASSRQSVGRGLPKLAKICLRIDVQYLGNAA